MIFLTLTYGMCTHFLVQRVSLFDEMINSMDDDLQLN